MAEQDRWLPVAESVNIFRCQCCGRINIAFYQDGEPIAFAPMTDDEASAILNQFTEAMAPKEQRQ